MTQEVRERTSLRYVLWVAVVLVLGALLWWMHAHVAFDWHTLMAQMRGVSWRYVVAAITLIYFSFVMRGVRWRILLGRATPAKTGQLIWPQFIGFTGVALVGRLADLSRPYLIARKLHATVASQLAVYSIERALDLGAAAILFSVTLALAPRGLAHHAAYVRAGVASSAATLGIAVFAVALRLAGERVARLVRAMLSPVSKTFAEKLAERLMEFRAGLLALSTLGELGSALATSLVIWGAIALCYLLTARAFQAEPALATMSFTATMLIMATSMGGSLLQLPIIGWFTQIALIAAAFHAFFDVPIETATACSALLLFDCTLCIVPIGLIAARLTGTSVRATTSQDEVVAASS
jgi:uncharacterized membrane protein YbhN (UPF0104 family)